MEKDQLLKFRFRFTFGCGRGERDQRGCAG